MRTVINRRGQTKADGAESAEWMEAKSLFFLLLLQMLVDRQALPLTEMPFFVIN